MRFTRRHFNALLTAATASFAIPRRLRAAEPATWLLFTKSASFEHTTTQRSGEDTSFLARQLIPIFADRGITLVESKDGRDFEPDRIARYAGFVFYTTGDLRIEGKDKQPPMSDGGLKGLLEAVGDGRPFIGLHCASDTFHGEGEPSDFTKMLGGEFDAHGEQQPATARVADPRFPGIGEQADWSFTEEWYALKNLAADLHPIHVLETAGLKGDMYQREPFPITWTRTHGKGRVFYTAIGHREDVIASKPYLRLIGGAIEWCTRAADG